MQAWQYLDSSTFKILNASIILPILLLLLEVIFKIGAKRKEEHEERQWECIEKTSQMWNQLFSLASEVRYFEKDANKGARIEDILLKLANLIGPAEDIVNMWDFRFFRGISDEDRGYSKRVAINSFLVPLNVLLRSTFTVAYFIRYANKEEEKEIQWLQSSLEKIQGGISGMAHHSIINVLKHSMYLEDGDKTAIKEIQENIGKLRENADWLKKMEKYNKLFPSVEGNEVDEFRIAVENSKKAGKESDNLKNLFSKIPSEKRPRLKDVVYSTDYVKRLADEMTYDAISKGFRKPPKTSENITKVHKEESVTRSKSKSSQDR
jgi:hypothetical protein